MAKNANNYNSIKVPKSWKNPTFELNQMIELTRPDEDNEYFTLSGRVLGFLRSNDSWIYFVELTKSSLKARQELGLSISDLIGSLDCYPCHDFVEEAEIVTNNNQLRMVA